MADISHWSEEQMVLHYYGEEESSELTRHLESCSLCREQFRLLQRVLNTVNGASPPERPADYEAAVWRKLQPGLGRSAKSSWLAWFSPRPWAVGAVAALLLAGAFLAGRWTTPKQPVQLAANAQQVRERVLVVAVGDHLDRSQMLLLELVNSPDGRHVNISNEQRTAEDLVEENRLYRQTALRTGDTRVAAVLEGLERVLLEVAHSPSTVNPAQMQVIRQDIEDNGVLFQMQVLNSSLRQPGSRPVTGGSRL